MDNEVIGTPIKAYRSFRCFNCLKFFEIDLENITDKANDSITLICPWCNESRIEFTSPSILFGDRVVRCD